jgi:uncharacterized protein YjiS (DUF1127 family)
MESIMSSTIVAKVNFSLPQLGRFSLSALGRAVRAAFWAADRFVAYGRCRQAMAVLMAMDDRQLKDLGIHRSEIAAYVHGRFGSRGSEGT